MIQNSKSDRKESLAARVLGSGTSGVLELLGFHPVDTVAKRLMNSKLKVFLDLPSFIKYFTEIFVSPFPMVKAYLKALELSIPLFSRCKSMITNL
jgi:hypothetical protein